MGEEVKMKRERERERERESHRRWCCEAKCTRTRNHQHGDEKRERQEKRACLFRKPRVRHHSVPSTIKAEEGKLLLLTKETHKKNT